jgi:hypothetical protein
MTTRSQLLAEALAAVNAHDGWSLGYVHVGHRRAVAVFREDGKVEWSRWADEPVIHDLSEVVRGGLSGFAAFDAVLRAPRVEVPPPPVSLFRARREDVADE